MLLVLRFVLRGVFENLSDEIRRRGADADLQRKIDEQYSFPVGPLGLRASARGTKDKGVHAELALVVQALRHPNDLTKGTKLVPWDLSAVSFTPSSLLCFLAHVQAMKSTYCPNRLRRFDLCRERIRELLRNPLLVRNALAVMKRVAAPNYVQIDEGEAALGTTPPPSTRRGRPLTPPRLSTGSGLVAAAFSGLEGRVESAEAANAALRIENAKLVEQAAKASRSVLNLGGNGPQEFANALVAAVDERAASSTSEPLFGGGDLAELDPQQLATLLRANRIANFEYSALDNAIDRVPGCREELEQTADVRGSGHLVKRKARQLALLLASAARARAKPATRILRVWDPLLR